MMNMRAKLKLIQKTSNEHAEDLRFSAVGPSGRYPEDGTDENNSYAKFTPSAELHMQVTNPALFGQFNPGDEFYVDFTPVKPS